MRHALTFMLCITSISACSQFPELDAHNISRDQQADYPSFLTQDQMLKLPNAGHVPAQIDLTGRLARLKLRANKLRQPILSSADRAHLGREIR
ncbi:MAG: hypothetical protein ACPGRD_07305 [Planktomarina sp.]